MNRPQAIKVQYHEAIERALNINQHHDIDLEVVRIVHDLGHTINEAIQDVTNEQNIRNGIKAETVHGIDAAENVNEADDVHCHGIVDVEANPVNVDETTIDQEN